nr:MAG TPA: hypothetical protein [Caudoviricetes sp.]
MRKNWVVLVTIPLFCPLNAIANASILRLLIT